MNSGGTQMHSKTETGGGQGLWGGAREAEETGGPAEPFEKRWAISGESGAGLIREIELRQGMGMLLFDCEPMISLASGSDSRPPTIGFNFFISGNVRGRIEGDRHETVTRGGQCAVVCSRERRGSIQSVDKKRMRIVSVQVALPQFDELLQGRHDPVADEFRGIIHGVRKTPYQRVERTMPDMEIALHQILHCPYQGVTRRLYLESRALELIAHQLELLARQRRRPETAGLRPDDIERIHHAGEILAGRLENPPGIMELTRTVGLTHVKLQRGFRQVFGATPFGYLRILRLNRARHLMQDAGLNVTQAAYTVGYASLSHFAKAFREQFGVSPRDLLGRFL
jgi:AraC-like DNA-binding protein